MYATIRCWLVFVMLSGATSAFAEMPEAGAIFVDPDPAAQVRKAPTFDAEIAYVPANAVAIASRAYAYLRVGDVDRARRELDVALNLANDGEDYRQVLWSAGWALYDMNQVRDALTFWRRGVQRHGGKPFWAPYTYALGYWTRRQSKEALAWYTVAARSNPEWSTRKGVDTRTRAWSPRQRKEMLELFRTWRKSPHAKDFLLRK